MRIDLDEESFLDVCNVWRGSFAPISEFSGREDFFSVAADFKLTSGDFFPFPISLDLGAVAPEADTKSLKSLKIYWQGEHIGEIHVTDVFEVDRREIAQQLLGSTNDEHPGVRSIMSYCGPFIGGSVRLKNEFTDQQRQIYFSPQDVTSLIRQRGWKKITGFASRNVPHRGHEFLISKYGSEADGFLVQPTIAQIAPGKYTEDAIRGSFEYLISNKLDRQKFILSPIPARSLTAGPREALLQAVIRRNFGCSHFIIGRDHSGVGDFYGKYDAQELAKKYSAVMGVEIIHSREPYYCQVCDDIVTDESCSHLHSHPDKIFTINSTDIRQAQKIGENVEQYFFDRDMYDAISHLKIFH